MNNKFFRYLVLLSVICLSVYAAQSNQSDKLLSPSVQKIVNKHNLDIVDYLYVNTVVSKKNQKPLIIDGRSEKKYLTGHIPFAKSLPVLEFEKNIAKFNHISKGREIITYCGGYSCSKSSELATKLKAKGFTNIKVYLGGMPEWIKRNYIVVETPSVLSSYKKNSALFIDARPYKVYIRGTIPGALSIPDTKMDSLSGRFPRDKNTQIITFCGGHKCYKSHNIAKALIKDSYTDVRVYAAGMPDWKQAGCQTTSRKIVAPKEESVKKVVLTSGVVAGSDEGTVDGEWFKSHLNKRPLTVQIVDVRPKSDFDIGHIKGAINIYAEKLSAKKFLALLPKNETIVFSCASGGRALEAWMKLNSAKLDVSKIFYFDANINCQDSECKIEVNEPLD